ncbi:MAG: aldehyde ferredoxin oxidoreductase C-terminal domain-containing protein [Pseudomonadota bacterium]
MSVHDEKWHARTGRWGIHEKTIPDYWTPEVEKDWTETMERMQTQLIGCYNCPLQCKATITPKGKPTYALKCWTKMTYAMYADLDFNLRILQPASEYGLDGVSTPRTINFALRLLYGGILTETDFSQLPESLADRYGVQKLLNTVRRLLESKNFGKKI